MRSSSQRSVARSTSVTRSVLLLFELTVPSPDLPRISSPAPVARVTAYRPRSGVLSLTSADAIVINMSGEATPDGRAFGIDIGGTGIKGAIVDTTTGQLVTKRTRILTPRPSTPDAVADVVAKLVSDAGWHGPVGCTFPAVIQHGVARSAANVDPSWIGTDVDACFTTATGSATDVYVLNDADAAGIAEARFGAAKGVPG